MVLQELIKLYRDKSGKAFGSLFNKINRSESLLKELVSVSTFLDEHYTNIPTQQRFYHVWFSHYELELCPYCGANREFSRMNKFSIDRYGIKPTNPVNYYKTCRSVECDKKYNQETTQKAIQEKYGVDNISQTEQWHTSIKKTNQEKYGCDYQTQSNNFKQKTKETWQEKYGVDHHTKTESTQNKKRYTVKERYGVDHVLHIPENLDKRKETCIERYGVDSPLQNDDIKNKAKSTNMERHGSEWYVQTCEFKNKSKETCLEKYGVEFAVQDVKVFEKMLKSGLKKKVFQFPSGRTENIQGYKHFAIIDLLKQGIHEEDIVIKNSEIEEHVGCIWYKGSDHKQHKYYPDIYVKSLNKIIEIKSEYTYNCALTINLKKKAATEAQDLSFEFWIYNDKGIKNNIIKNEQTI
jgi:hypothetical protein